MNEPIELLCCSDDDECFCNDCGSVEEAIAIAKLEGWEKVYVGRKRPIRWKDLLGDIVWRILEAASERAWEEVGEVAENWPDPSPEQRAALGAAITAAVELWADAHGLQPTFYGVDDVKRYDVPERDDEQQAT